MVVLASNLIDGLALGVSAVVAVGTLVAFILKSRQDRRRDRAIEGIQRDQVRQFADLNAKIAEANDIARAGSQVRIELRPYLYTRKDNPTAFWPAVEVRNTGGVEARINAVELLVDGADPIKVGQAIGDIELTVSPGMMAHLPGTLRPGARFDYIFTEFGHDSVGGAMAIPPNKSADSRWSNATGVRVDASHIEFFSKDNGAIQELKRRVQRVM